MSNVVIFGETGTNCVPVSVDVDGNMNVNIVSGGGGGGGAVQIQDSNGNDLLGTNDALDVNIKGVDLITVGTETGLQTNILNNSINTHIYGSSDGITWHHALTNPNGKLQVNAGVQDNNGIDITGTAITTSIKALDTSSTLYSVNGTTRTAISSTGSNLNVNVSNTVPVSGTFYPATQPVSGTVAISGTVPVSGTFYQATQPVSIASTVSVNQVMNKLGDVSNIASNLSLLAGTATVFFDVSTYGDKCLISYEDTNTNSLTCVFIYGSTPVSNPFTIPILKLSPTKGQNSSKRYAYAYIDLSPFQLIRLYNESAENLTNVYCSVVSG